MNTVIAAAENFISHAETIAGVEAFGHGIIHDTYLVKLGNGADCFILQCINTQVFTKPAAVMHNLRLVCAHMQKRRTVSGSSIDAGWQVLEVMPARDGRDFFVDAHGAFWRALRFIRGASPLEQMSCLHDAGEVGRALGIFHWLLSDLNPGLLHTTLPGFHNIAHYLKQYDEVLARSNKSGDAGRF